MVAEGPSRLEETEALEDGLGGVGARDDGQDAAAATTGATPDVGAEGAGLQSTNAPNSTTRRTVPR